LRAALEITEKALGPEHPTVARTLKYYAILLRKMERKLEAKHVEARAHALLAKTGNRAGVHSTVTVEALAFTEKGRNDK
jgi:hypothetical protein